MSAFRLTKNSYFICSDNRSTIRVLDYQGSLDDVTNPNAPIKYPAVVGPGQAYSALEVFGVVIQGNRLTQLAYDLKDSRCIVNREGFCILNNTSAAIQGLPAVLGRQYLRLNDLFIWSKYGVRPTITTVWNRRDQYSNQILVNYGDLRDRLARSERSLQQKKEELAECKTKLAKLAEKERKREKELTDKEERLLEEMEKELEELAAELKLTKKKLSECEKSSSKDLEAMEEKLEDLAEERDFAKRKLSDCKKTLRERENELADMDDELRAKDEEIQELIEALDKLTNP